MRRLGGNSAGVVASVSAKYRLMKSKGFPTRRIELLRPLRLLQNNDYLFLSLELVIVAREEVLDCVAGQRCDE